MTIWEHSTLRHEDLKPAARVRVVADKVRSVQRLSFNEWTKQMLQPEPQFAHLENGDNHIHLVGLLQEQNTRNINMTT